MPVRTRHKGQRDEDQIKRRKGQRDALPRPITVRDQSEIKDDDRSADGNGGRHFEKAQPGADGDEFRNQGQEISNGQVGDGEPSPEGTEAGEYQFGMAAMSGGAHTHGHFLDHDRHGKGKNDEGEKETDAETSTGGGVRDHAGAVVFTQHHQDTGANQKPEQTQARAQAGVGAGFGYAIAVLCAVYVFMVEYLIGRAGLDWTAQTCNRLRSITSVTYD